MTPWQEQTAFEKAQRQEKVQRILKAAREGLSLDALEERFGWTKAAIRHVLAKAGIRMEPDFFSDYHNNRRHG